MSKKKGDTTGPKRGRPAGAALPGGGASKRDLVLVGLIANPTEEDCRALANALCDAAEQD
ncbi:MAG: hypothetical protein HY874_00345 [Chloroflexi bacterium]|nr:hypothetical protein [Chloroflexota bacterium]